MFQSILVSLCIFINFQKWHFHIYRKHNYYIGKRFAILTSRVCTATYYCQMSSYLKSLLQADAARVIEGFQLTHSNYTKTLDLLYERFGKEHKIVNAYMQNLLEYHVLHVTLSVSDCFKRKWSRMSEVNSPLVKVKNHMAAYLFQWYWGNFGLRLNATWHVPWRQ